MHLFKSIECAQQLATEGLWTNAIRQSGSTPKTTATSSLTSTNNCFGEEGDYKGREGLCPFAND